MSRWMGNGKGFTVSDYDCAYKSINFEFDKNYNSLATMVTLSETVEVGRFQEREDKHHFCLSERETEVLWDYCGDHLGKTKKIVDLLKEIHILGALGEKFDSKIRLLLADEFNDWDLYKDMSHLAYTNDKELNNVK